MNIGMELLSGVKNPNTVGYATLAPRRALSSCSPTALKLQSLLRPRVARLCIGASPKVGLPSLGLQVIRSRCVVAVSSSHEDSHPEIEAGKEKDDLNFEAEESEEAWKQTLESFKEQALKMQSISQEAYEAYSKKAMVILNDTSEQLKIQAEKTRNDLTLLAKEISQESKEYLSVASENCPEPVKEIMQTYSSTADDVKEVYQVRDFHVGIPYGFLLSVGGFLSFMLTGSTSAIRFGIILGGALLALSVWSLKSYQKGESPSLPLIGQAAIAAIIFLREIRLLFQWCHSCVLSIWDQIVRQAKWKPRRGVMNQKIDLVVPAEAVVISICCCLC